jgi:hypothetical protein
MSPCRALAAHSRALRVSSLPARNPGRKPGGNSGDNSGGAPRQASVRNTVPGAGLPRHVRIRVASPNEDQAPRPWRVGFVDWWRLE